MAASALLILIAAVTDKLLAIVGLLIILYVAIDMVYRGVVEVWPHVSPVVS